MNTGSFGVQCSSVSWAAKKKPAMVAPHIKEIVAQLERNDVHAAVIRNSVRVLEND